MWCCNQRSTVDGLGCRGNPDRSPMLKAFPAKDGTTLSRLEGDCRLLPALRANRFGFDALSPGRTVTGAASPLRACCLAGLAALRLVSEPFVGEKHLFAGRENKLRPTIGTLQDPIMVFHTLLRTRTGRGPSSIPSKQRLPASIAYTNAFYRANAAWKEPN
jgi:hypothetical protein